MNIQINFELTDKEIEYIKFINDIVDEFGIINVDIYTLSKYNFTESHNNIYSKAIINYNHELEYYYTTYLFDEILKQLPK